MTGESDFLRLNSGLRLADNVVLTKKGPGVLQIEDRISVGENVVIDHQFGTVELNARLLGNPDSLITLTGPGDSV